MKKIGRLEIITAVIIIVTSLAVPAGAAITWSGDVEPSDPSTWDSSTYGNIGDTGYGTMSITGGSDVSNFWSHIGYLSGSTGAVTVDGAGSTWTTGSNLYVGPYGDGTLNITGGGEVSNRYSHIGYGSGAVGVVTVDGSGSTWTNSNSLGVGAYSNGTLNITGGGTVISNNSYGYIGRRSSGTGEVTVDGAGSTLTYNDDLFVGYAGNGTLSITDGGAVTVDIETWVGYEPSASGVINFNNGTLTTSGLGCNFDDLTGTGTINTNGQVCDGDLIFDSADDLTQTYILNEAGQNITVNLDVDGSGSMGAGYAGSGTMSISNGITVESYTGHIGHKSGSTGIVSVDGVGSTWTNSDGLKVGYYDGSNGTLNITGGGTVSSNSYCYIGRESGSTGAVNVDGAGSTWTNSNSFIVGRQGNGTLNITGGGAVTNEYAIIGEDWGSTGVVTVDGVGSTLTNSGNLSVGHEGNGSLNVTNGGTVSVAGSLTIDYDDDEGYGDGSVNMSTGGMLALPGDVDDSLAEFMGLIEGVGAIHYWDSSTAGWADITGARYGIDYTLEYQTEGGLAGCTMLTVLEPVIYVDASAAGANNGYCWADAYNNVYDALDIAQGGDEIRVAQGTYRPDTDGLADPREATFQMINGVTIEGGYVGYGEPEPNARDIELYETILSGDLLGNDEPDFVNNDENSYHIVNGTGTNSTAVLDGFIITGGNASVGGGMYMADGSSPTVLNCTFRGNSAINGGGMWIEEGGTSIIKNCIFSANSASSWGGGLYGEDECDLTLINCIFTGNMADFGGGMYNYGGDMSRQSLTNCTFYGNSASSTGGAIYNSLNSSSTLTNCTFYGNSASSTGGAIYNSLHSRSTLTNCILWSNSPDEIDLNRAIVSYSDIQGGLPGVGNIDVDPLFADPNGPDGIVGTEDDDLRLLADSLCIDAGDNSVVTVTTDLDGNERIVNNFVDMGAYEFQGLHEIYVDDDAAGDPGPDDPEISDPDENGTQAHPFDTIQEAVDISKDGHAVLVLPGLYIGPDIFIQAVSFDKNITLTSIDPTDWSVVEDTIIAGSVSFSGTEDPTCMLTGFKIQNTFFGNVLGNGTLATISHCIITGNGPCLATVINDCDGLISNCMITDNSTFAQCGVFPVVYDCNGSIKNCTIANNISGIGDWSGGSMTLENCIVYNNGEGGDPQVSISGGGTLNVSYCNIQGGLQGVDSDGAVNWGWGNIDVDPQFVRWGLWDYDALELAEGNYHLQSLGWRLSEYDPDWTYDFVTSRCIDAGNPGSPLADELMNVPRDPDNNFGINLRVNMGAYGGTTQASMAPYNWALLGDLSNDGTVAHEDLVGQAEGWLTSASLQPGDLNRDGIVNMADFAALAKDWLQQTDWAQ